MVTELTDQQRKERALELLKIIRRGMFESCYAMKLVNDNKFYIELGYNSMVEFSASELNYAKSATYAFLQIAERFLPLTNDINLFHDHGMSSIPYYKLTILANLTSEQARELLEKGTFLFEENVYTISDINLMSVDELRLLINGEEETEPGIKTSLEIPFQKVYNVVEKAFTKILKNVTNCSDISVPDQKQIELFLAPIANILDKYKREEEATRKIK